MASESGTTTTPEMQWAPSSTNRTFSIFIPFFFGFAHADPSQTGSESDQNGGNPDENLTNNQSPDGQNPAQRDRVILINPLTPGMVVIEGTGLNLNTLFRMPLEKEGPPPAAKSAIEAMPSVEVGEGVDGECAICLEEWVTGVTVKEMPCKHRFHGGCIEKWLGMHGSCPVCRYAMPVEEEEKEKKVEEREEEGGERREIWVSFSFGGMRRTGEQPESGGDGADGPNGSGEPGDQDSSYSGSDSNDGGQSEGHGEDSGDICASNSNSSEESGMMDDID